MRNRPWTRVGLDGNATQKTSPEEREWVDMLTRVGRWRRTRLRKASDWWKRLGKWFLSIRKSWNGRCLGVSWYVSDLTNLIVNSLSWLMWSSPGSWKEENWGWGWLFQSWRKVLMSLNSCHLRNPLGKASVLFILGVWCILVFRFGWQFNVYRFIYLIGEFSLCLVHHWFWLVGLLDHILCSDVLSWRKSSIHRFIGRVKNCGSVEMFSQICNIKMKWSMLF